MGLNSLFLKMGVSDKLAGDMSLFLVLVAISLMFGMFVGRFRLANILINIYIAAAILTAVPESFLNFHANSNLLLFLFLLTVLTIIGDSLFDIHIPSSGSGFFGRLVVMSFLEVGLIFSVIISMTPSDKLLEYVSQNMYQYFASPSAKIFWMIAPLAFLFFINRRSK